ncbi:MAG: multiheme c-type cytochrome [Pseudomonadota bacterium]
MFYSADLHGQYAALGVGTTARGGLARRATLVDEARVTMPDVLVVDAGDAVAAEEPDAAVRAPVGGQAWGTSVVLEAYRRIGVNVMVPGERELALGPRALGRLRAKTKVPMVAANVTEKHPAGPPAALLARDAMFEGAGPHTVGILGLVDLSPALAASVGRAGFVVGDPVAAAVATTQSLRARGASFLIAIVHTDGGAERALRILNDAGLGSGPSAVDALVLGHDDATALPPTAVAGVDAGLRPDADAGALALRVAPRAGLLGATLGRIDVFWPPPGGAAAPPRLEQRILPVTAATAEQHGVALIGRVLTTTVVDDGHLANEYTGRGKGGKGGKGLNRATEPELAETWTYGSNSGCRLCHQTEDAQWKTTDHAHALATLKVTKHDRDPACLGCHMTGFLSPGGTHNLKTAYTYFSDVGCEACHGPSVEHIRDPQKKAGTIRKVAAMVCLGCHTPDQNRGPFDVVAAMKEVVGPGHGAGP